MRKYYEDLNGRFGKKNPPEEPYCTISDEQCPAYVARGSRCNGRRTIVCTQGANITGRGYGEVTRSEADACLAQKRAEFQSAAERSEPEDTQSPTPPGP